MDKMKLSLNIRQLSQVTTTVFPPYGAKPVDSLVGHLPSRFERPRLHLSPEMDQRNLKFDTAELLFFLRMPVVNGIFLSFPPATEAEVHRAHSQPLHQRSL